MRIIVDKAVGEPPHSLSKRELKVIFANVPASWLEGLKVVELRNTLPPKNAPTATLWLGELLICSRDRDKEWVVTEVLNQLAQHSLGWESARGQLTRGQREKLRPMIAPV